MNPRASWLAVGLLPLVACAGEDGGATQVGVGRRQVAIEIGPRYAMGQETTLRGVLAIDVASGGTFTGTIALAGFPTQVSTVTGRITRGVLTLDPESVGIFPDGSLEWERFSMQTGARGELEGAAGTIQGTRTYVHGDALESVRFYADVVASTDTSGEMLGLLAYDPSPGGDLLPIDRIEVALGEPAAEARVADVRVLADGAAMPGAVTTNALSGLVSSMVFQASTFWPFGATLSADPNGIADPSGNLLVAGPALHVVTDPGPAMANLGFEAGLTGWTRRGESAHVVGPLFGVTPVEGTQQLALADSSQIAGYVDVPSDATSLSLSVVALIGTGPVHAALTGFVALHRAGGERIIVFDAADERANATPCNCGGAAETRVGPLTRTVDLTPYRGERLFLTARTQQGFFANQFILILDDLRIQ